MNLYSAATVLNSVQPQLQTSAQTMFQPSAAVQVMSAAAQAANTVSQSNISLAALQSAGLSINPAIVRMQSNEIYFLNCLLYNVSHAITFLTHVVFLLLRSMLPLWELSPSSSVPSPPLLSSLMPSPTWLASPARSSQMLKDRWVPQNHASQFICVSLDLTYGLSLLLLPAKGKMRIFCKENNIIPVLIVV